MSQQENTCKDCQFWNAAPPSKERFAEKEPALGECHRHAPKPQVIVIPVPPGAVGFKPPGFCTMTQFPPTNEFMFCGEFTQRRLRLAAEPEN